MNYDLTDLKLVRLIAEHGSLRNAASAARLSPSSASARLCRLESELGVTLFFRHRRGLTPTRAGSVALRHLDRLFLTLSALEAPFLKENTVQTTAIDNNAQENPQTPH